MPRFTGRRCGQNVSSTALPVRSSEHALDLADVPVRAPGRVGREVLGHLAEEQILAQRAAGAGRAALGVGDDALGLDEPVLEQRDERQQHRGRVAAGVRDEPRSAQRLAVVLREAEDRLADELGRRRARGRTTSGRPRRSAAAGRRRGRPRATVGPRRAKLRGVARGDPVRQREHVGVRRLLETLLVGEVPRPAAGRERDRGARVRAAAGAPAPAPCSPSPRRLRRERSSSLVLPPKKKPAGNRPAGAHESDPSRPLGRVLGTPPAGCTGLASRGPRVARRASRHDRSRIIGPLPRVSRGATKGSAPRPCPPR